MKNKKLLKPVSEGKKLRKNPYQKLDEITTPYTEITPASADNCIKNTQLASSDALVDKSQPLHLQPLTALKLTKLPLFKTWSQTLNSQHHMMRPITILFLCSYMSIFTICLFYILKQHEMKNDRKAEYEELSQQLDEIMKFKDQFLAKRATFEALERSEEAVLEEAESHTERADSAGNLLFSENHLKTGEMASQIVASINVDKPFKQDSLKKWEDNLTSFDKNARGIETTFENAIFIETKKESTTPKLTEKINPTSSPSGPKFAPYHIAKNAQQEALACLKFDYDCQDCPESKSTWPDIPPELYKTNILDFKSHTSPKDSIIELENTSCLVNSNSFIKIKIRARNFKNENKIYGGDYFLARMVPVSQHNYTKYQVSDYSFGTIISGIKQDFFNGTYQFQIPCLLPGKFMVQVFLIRHSEAIEGTKRIMAGVNPKSRVFRGTINGEPVGRCGPILPEMLEDAPTKDDYCVINATPGREWYCEKPPKSKTCGPLEWLGFDARAWVMGDVVGQYKLDNVYEDLAFTGEVEVLPGQIESKEKPAQSSPESGSETLKNSQIPGFWNHLKWIDSKIPKYSGPLKHHNIFKNKIFIIMGDSLSAQFMTEFKSASEKYARDILRQGAGKFKCTKQEYGFLGIIKGDKCPENPGPWAPNIFHCAGTNTTFVRLPHGMPIHKDGCVETAQYTGDMLEQMIKENWVGPEYVILMTHGAHFATFNPILFHNRLLDLKQAVEKYKQASPKSLVIFKTLNYIRGDFSKLWSTVSGFNAYRQREMAFKIFGDPNVQDMRDDKFKVKVFDVWPMTELAFDHMDVGNVHPGWGKSSDWMLSEIIEYFIDFLAYLNYI